MVAFERECKGNDVAPGIKVAFGRECKGNDVASDIKVAFGRECKVKASVVGVDVLVIVILAEDGGRNRKSNSIWKLAESILGCI